QPLPDVLRKDALWQTEVVLADLARVPMRTRSRWERDLDRDSHDEDGDHFEDSCERYHERLNRSYYPQVGTWSSWQCGQILQVPAKVVSEAGAYVLAVEANGQTAYAPLIVEPLSLTMRRCRDGIFVAVSDASGKTPVAAACVSGRDMIGTAITDAEGIA